MKWDIFTYSTRIPILLNRFNKKDRNIGIKIGIKPYAKHQLPSLWDVSSDTRALKTTVANCYVMWLLVFRAAKRDHQNQHITLILGEVTLLVDY